MSVRERETVSHDVSGPGTGRFRTLCEAFQATAAERGDEIALRTVGGEAGLTWSQYAERMRAIAAGLARLGVGRGETVGLMLVNRPEFHLCDTAVMHLGAVPFSVYNTSTPEQIAYLLGNAGNRIMIAELRFLEQIRAAGVALDHVVCVDGAPEGTIGLEQLEASGDRDHDLDSGWRAVQGDDLATLCYTSGTTGVPKAVQLSHANVLAEAYGFAAAMGLGKGGRTVSYLPNAHMVARQTGHYNQMVFGLTVTDIADPRTIAAALPDARPTTFCAVPRIWEKFKAALEAQSITDPATLSEEAKRSVRETLGLDQCRVMHSGAAPAPLEVLAYFREIGLEIYEGWGLTELTMAATTNRPGQVKLGTVGQAMPGVEVRLADDGELFARGSVLMPGYRNDPEMTAEAIDADGWLHTGDLATIDEDGYVTIIDRKKEVIINAAGKNMSPTSIEARVTTSSPLIGQAIAIGDRRPFNVALIVLDPDVCAQWAAERELEDPSPATLATNEEMQSEIARAIAEANTHLSRVEQIKRFAVLPFEWLPGGDELTPSMKLKRRPIAEKYAAQIEALYAG